MQIFPSSLGARMVRCRRIITATAKLRRTAAREVAPVDPDDFFTSSKAQTRRGVEDQAGRCFEEPEVQVQSPLRHA